MLRVAIVAVLFTILGFSLGLLLGIVATAALNATGITRQSMQAALWAFAIPGAVLGLIAGLVVMAVTETRASNSSF